MVLNGSSAEYTGGIQWIGAVTYSGGKLKLHEREREGRDITLTVGDLFPK